MNKVAWIGTGVMGGPMAGHLAAKGYPVSAYNRSPEKLAAGSWQINHMAPRVLKGDLAPGFFIKHFIKDMKIVEEEVQAKGVTLEMLESVLKLYQGMAEKGFENDGTQALIKYYG